MTNFLKNNKGASILSLLIALTFLLLFVLLFYFNFYDNIKNFTGEEFAEYYLDSLLKQNEKKYIKCFPDFYTSDLKIEENLMKHFNKECFQEEYTYSIKANYTSKDGKLFNTYNTYVQKNLPKYWLKKTKQKFIVPDVIFEEFCSVNYTLKPKDSSLEEIDETILLVKVNGLWGVLTID